MTSVIPVMAKKDEMIKSYFASVIARNNQKVQELSIDTPTHAIGFAIGEEVEDYDDDL